MEITFANPNMLWLLFCVPFLLLIHFYSLRFVNRRAMMIANFEALKRVSGSYLLSRNILLLILRLSTLLFMILAVAGTILWYEGDTAEQNFILAIDNSGSMLAQDNGENRLEAAKVAAGGFVENLTAKASVGVVSFAGIASPEVELTDNKAIVTQAIDGLQVSSIHGTAIGHALWLSSSLLATADKAKVVILLSDGQENVAPLELPKIVDLLDQNQITVHTIGIGTAEGGILPNMTAVSMLDNTTLVIIANATGGRYFHAKTMEDLHDSYLSIAEKEKSKIPVDLTMPFLILALLILSVEWVVVNTKYRTIP